MSATRPITLLIAALGGEGGGVLTDWIVSATAEAGFPVQSTSIPGVAQRTGATTYYIEILPALARELGGKRPVLALTPGVGDIDIAVASEMLEAGRMVANGFVTPARTHLIASLSRFYAMDEKIAMGDGRFDQDKLIKTVKDNTRDALLIDMDALAKQSGSIINAVMLGAIAGSQGLPVTAGQFEAAIRGDGKSVDSNLRGFRAGLKAARAKIAPAKTADKKNHAPTTPDLPEQEVSYSLPVLAQSTAIEGVRRLIAYQSVGYARLYLDRLRALVDADAAAGVAGKLLKEVARHLAVRMSYEDVVRVAQAKIAPQRVRRIAREELRVKNEPFSVHDFLKPGIEELCQLLPSFLARPILALAERRGWLGHVYFGMEINSTSISGYLRFLMLAKLRGLRPHGHRYKQEQVQIESWLALIAEAARRSGEFAIEVAECARLIKGYGDTYARGLSNYRSIEACVIRPALAGHIPPQRAADAVASARTAALVDPEGESLAKCLAKIDGTGTFRIAAE
jgi:indolepyruvate ferredoxin oxidoreductase, beta subunit